MTTLYRISIGLEQRQIGYATALARAYGDPELVTVTGATLIIVATVDPQGTLDALRPSITIDNVRWINVSRNE